MLRLFSCFTELKFQKPLDPQRYHFFWVITFYLLFMEQDTVKKLWLKEYFEKIHYVVRLREGPLLWSQVIW